MALDLLQKAAIHAHMQKRPAGRPVAHWLREHARVTGINFYTLKDYWWDQGGRHAPTPPTGGDDGK